MMDTLAHSIRLPNAVRRFGGKTPFDVLRDEIIAFALVPGTVLSRSDLQARFGVSSTPIRDALTRLAEEGLVDIFPQHATIIAPIDEKLAREAQFLRRSLEIEIARELAIAADPAVAVALRASVRQQAALADAGDHQAFEEADIAFHAAMAHAAGAGALWQMTRRRSGHIDRLRRLHLPLPGKIREVVSEHHAIVDSIEGRRPADAQLHMREHLSHSLEMLPKLKAEHAAWFRSEAA
jgi:GntR family transcriptional regulator, rspAB operon transcriptional repressor